MNIKLANIHTLHTIKLRVGERELNIYKFYIIHIYALKGILRERESESKNVSQEFRKYLKFAQGLPHIGDYKIYVEIMLKFNQNNMCSQTHTHTQSRQPEGVLWQWQSAIQSFYDFRTTS